MQPRSHSEAFASSLPARGSGKTTPRSSSRARRRWCSAPLLERPGAPVSKQELFASVWRGTVVSDDALVTCIQELRKALGDDSKQPIYIETRHRLGYRFAAPVATRAEPPAAPRQPRAIDAAAIAVLPFADMSPRARPGLSMRGPGRRTHRRAHAHRRAARRRAHVLVPVSRRPRPARSGPQARSR